MGSVLHQLYQRYCEALTLTASMAIRPWEAFTFYYYRYYYFCYIVIDTHVWGLSAMMQKDAKSLHHWPTGDQLSRTWILIMNQRR